MSALQTAPPPGMPRRAGTVAIPHALARGREAAAVRIAIGRGLADENALTNLVFHGRHPQRGGRMPATGEPALRREWLDIRQDVVRPLLADARPRRAPIAVAMRGGFVPAPVEHPGGGRITDKRPARSTDLVPVQGVNGPVALHRDAARALAALVRDARRDGLPAPLLLPLSGQRSAGRQAALWHAAVRTYGSPAAARRWVSPPGASAHQTGRALDLYLGGRNSSANVDGLRALPAFRWMALNAARFGFFVDPHEPWHWEFNPVLHPALDEEAWRSKAERKKTPKSASDAHVAARDVHKGRRTHIQKTLKPPTGKDVHHKIELQVLKGYPGVFHPAKLNIDKNLVPVKQRYHRSNLRLFWDACYRSLDGAIAQAKLKPGTDPYAKLVRARIGACKRQADKLIAQHGEVPFATHAAGRIAVRVAEYEARTASRRAASQPPWHGSCGSGVDIASRKGRRMHDLDRQQLELARANGGAGALGEAQELELAGELLEVSSEEELVTWLGDVARRAAPTVTAAQRAVGKAYMGNRAVVDKVARFVKTVGPPVSAATSFSSGLPPDLAMQRANQLPGTVDTIAYWLGDRMQRWSKLELEGMSGEDRELEFARRYTRFAHRALRNAWRAPRRMPADRAARIAVSHAARNDLPGLVPHITQIFHIGANELSTTAGAGRWRRTGNAIVIDLG